MSIPVHVAGSAIQPTALSTREYLLLSLFILKKTEKESTTVCSHLSDMGDYMRYNIRMTKRTEEFSVNGDDLLAKVRALIAEGNVRRITVKSKEGKNVVELPLTVGIVGAALAPVLAAIGAMAALVTECSIVVEREE
jgi:hypothetical protein